MTGVPGIRTGARSGLDALADAALQVIDELTAGELLAAITPERLGQRSGYAPSSVRYQLSRTSREPEPIAGTGTGGAAAAAQPPRKRWAFDREHVLLIALDALAARQRESVRQSARGYLAALTILEQTGDLVALGQAIRSDLDTYTPGATEEGSALTSERVYAIAIAAADGSTEVARQLRRHHEERIALYVPVYERALAVSGRVGRDGCTVLDVARQVNLLLEGVSLRRRFEPALDERHVLSSVISIFQGMTRLEGDPASPDPAARLIREAAARRGAR